MKRVLVFTLIVAAVSAIPVAAQEAPGPLTWLAFDTSVSGKSRDLTQMTVENDGPMYDELVANGTLMSWGIAIPINHRLDDEWNWLLWATMADWAKVGELQAGFEKMFASRTPEQMAAMGAAYDEVTVGGMHFDWVVRQEVFRPGTSQERPNYFDVGYYTARPGMEQKLTEFFKTNVAPIYDKLLADGTITGYGMYTQELHGEPGWTHVSWLSMTNLGAKDAAEKVFLENFSEAQMAEAMSLMDWSAHKDQVLLIVHVGATASAE